jgi:hypothetical protein
MTATAAPSLPDGAIRAWENDPGTPDAPYVPIARPRPSLETAPFPLRIDGKPPIGPDEPGTPAFRFWAAAEALRRASDHWGGVIGRDAAWHPAIGAALPIALDAGVDFNAYYDRHGLHFFHDAAGGHTCWSGESPDVVCHEHGHAVLDALRPELFDAPFTEAAAVHEAFGDISALLAALQLPSVREALLVATGGRIERDSSVSRLAEQLGWAIRQTAPDAVDRDALRNLARTWFYRDPAQLPPSAPADQLSSEPHSFSRVFSGAFLHALSGMLQARRPRDADTLHDVARDAAGLLHRAIMTSPVVPAYMSQLAAHLVAADAEAFEGRYRAALTSAFVRHGILSVSTAAALTGAGAGARLTFALAAAPEPPMVRRIALSRTALGLPADLLVEAPDQPRRFAVAGAALDVGSAPHPTLERAAATFVEDLLRRGRIDLTAAGERRAALDHPLVARSHVLHREADGLVLRRRLFHCGLTA